MKPRQVPTPTARAVLDMDPAELAAELSKLPPNDQYVVAARVGAEISQSRREHQEQMRDSAKEVAADKRWQGYAARHLPHDEVARRREVPRIPTQRAPFDDEREEPAQWVPAPDSAAGDARVRGC